MKFNLNVQIDIMNPYGTIEAMASVEITEEVRNYINTTNEYKISEDFKRFLGFGGTKEEALTDLKTAMTTFGLHGSLHPTIIDHTDGGRKVTDAKLKDNLVETGSTEKSEPTQRRNREYDDNLPEGYYYKTSGIPGDTYRQLITPNSSIRERCRSLCD